MMYICVAENENYFFSLRISKNRSLPDFAKGHLLYAH